MSKRWAWLADFDSFVRRREPFIVSFDSIANLDTALGWSTKKWLSSTPYSREYLTEKVGDDEDVL
eukprot:gene35050-43218_t